MDITDRVPALIAAYNITTGQYLYVNNTSKALLGYSPQEFIKGGIPFAISLVHPDDMPQITRQNQEALAAANRKKSIRPDGTMIVNFEYRMKHKKGHWVWLHTVGNVLSRDPKTNRVNQVVNISFDITQRKESEKQALLDIEQINYALDQSAIVAVTDKAGMIQYVNDKFLEISHYSKDELVGKTHRVINSKYHPPEFFSKMWQTILSGKVWQGEIRNRAKNGQYYWVDTTITPRLDEHGQPKKFIAIRHDITKRKELERQKDEFIGIASHELKTPVTSLKGYTQILHTRFIKQGNHDAAAFMAKMDGQINKLNSLIQDLLDVTKIQTGKLQFHIETFDVNLLASEVIESLQLTTDRHTLSLQGKVKKNITGDRERIGQVLTNLLSNAIKYSPYDSQIIVSLSATKAQAKICVRDFGVGIALDKQPLIFKRFYRVTGAKQDTFPGLGLGLFISAQLIKRHHGQIWVESTQGKGSLFCFTLPFNGLAIKNQPNKLAEVELMHD